MHMASMTIGRVAVAIAAVLWTSAAAWAQSAGGLAWRHGIIEAKSDAGILLMVTRGFAERQGLRLDIVQFKSDAIGLKALLAGEIESYDGALTGTVVAASRGADVKLLGCHWPGLPHGIFVRSSITSVDDLKGKTFAISTPFSHPDVIARTLLARHNIDPAEVKFANMGGDVDRFKALVAGVVDATIVSGEYAPIAEKNGIRLLVAARDVVPDYMRLCMFSTGKILAARREDAIRFMAAEMSALRYALSHREEAIKLTQEITGAKPDDPRPGYIFDDAVRTAGVDADIAIPMDKVEWMRNLLVDGGQLPKTFDIGKMIDGEIRATALERIKK
jgi:NitT/TauT family transport system substrate-binding protein